MYLLLFAALLLFCVASQDNLEHNAHMYITANSAFYDAAEADCISLGYKMASLFSESERQVLNEYLADQLISKAWIGAKLDLGRPECVRQQMFTNNCWIWVGFEGPQMITPEMWDWEQIGSKQQNNLSCAYFNVTVGLLSFEHCNHTNRAICETFSDDVVES